MCNFLNIFCFLTIINGKYKNVFKLLLLVQHISFYSIFHYKLLRKIGSISNALKN